MKYLFLSYYFFLFCTNSCGVTDIYYNKKFIKFKTTKHQVSKIAFYHIPSDRAFSVNDTINGIFLTRDSVCLFENIYKDTLVIKSNIKKSITKNNEFFFEKIPYKYLDNNNFNFLNYIPICDEEFFYIALFFNKNNTNPDILWSIDRNSLPEDLKFVMEYYEKIRGSL